MPSTLVIPAKAGIQATTVLSATASLTIGYLNVSVSIETSANGLLDPGLRRDDGIKRTDG